MLVIESQTSSYLPPFQSRPSLVFCSVLCVYKLKINILYFLVKIPKQWDKRVCLNNNTALNIHVLDAMHCSLVPRLIPLHTIIQHMTFDLPEREKQRGQRSYVKLLCGRREEPGTRLMHCVVGIYVTVPRTFCDNYYIIAAVAMATFFTLP